MIVYPTDSCYALGCHIGDKAALERIRDIRQTDRNHHFTLVCRDLADVGKYALVDNWQYRLLRAHTPGPYTFLLKASRETPRRLKHERRGTIGLRVPDHPVTAMLLDRTGRAGDEFDPAAARRGTAAHRRAGDLRAARAQRRSGAGRRQLRADADLGDRSVRRTAPSWCASAAAMSAPLASAAPV